MTATVRLDLHVHSRFSPDGHMELGQIVDQLGVAGVQGFALTDHNSVAGHPRLRELQAAFPMYWLIPGVEVSTQEGHLLVYGAGEAPPAHRPLAETLDWVRARAAISVLAHPFRRAHGVGRALAERAPVDGIETANGHNAEVTNARAELVAARRGVSATGGSDAHRPADVGRAFTELTGDVSCVDDILSLLRRGASRGSGRSLSFGEQIRVSTQTALSRAARGFRAI
ncbi:MAG: CehA/McbA family metallohydrolase [Thermoplasmata archaeon]|nr:CehA/McbA family metallohydrolase [Thermoplasmata archaeon]